MQPHCWLTYLTRKQGKLSKPFPAMKNQGRSATALEGRKEGPLPKRLASVYPGGTEIPVQFSSPDCVKNCCQGTGGHLWLLPISAMLTNFGDHLHDCIDSSSGMKFIWL